MQDYIQENLQSQDFIDQWSQPDFVKNNVVTSDIVMRYRRHVYAEWWKKGVLDLEKISSLNFLESKLSNYEKNIYLPQKLSHMRQFSDMASVRNKDNWPPNNFFLYK